MRVRSARGRLRIIALAGAFLLGVLRCGSAQAPGPGPAPAPAPRLAGVVVGPDGSVAIFADDATGAWIAVLPGETVGPYRVQAITRDGVAVLAADGRHLLQPRARDVAQPGAPEAASAAPAIGPIETSMTDLGMRAGQAAARYDDCVRRGLLSDPGPSAAARVAAVAAAMAQVPARRGREAADAPTAAMAEWLRLGAAAGARQGLPPVDPGACTQAAAGWRAVARELGASK